MPSHCAPFSAMQASTIGACLDWRRRSRALAFIQWLDFRKAQVGNRFDSLIASLNTERPSHIRDRAIILLLAVYGLRIGEACALTLDDLDWTNEKIRVRRLKNKRIQDFPLPQRWEMPFLNTCGQCVPNALPALFFSRYTNLIGR